MEEVKNVRKDFVRVQDEPVARNKINISRASDTDSKQNVNDIKEIQISKSPLKPDEIEKFSKSLEKALNSSNKEIQFEVSSVEDAAKNINFKVIDKATGEVVREFPSEEVKRMAEKASKNMSEGLILDSSI